MLGAPQLRARETEVDKEDTVYASEKGGLVRAAGLPRASPWVLPDARARAFVGGYKGPIPGVYYGTADSKHRGSRPFLYGSKLPRRRHQF